MKSAELFERLLNAMMPHRTPPRLARVIKAGEGPGKTTYAVDVRILQHGSMEETDEVISEVPISPVWSGTSGEGIYAIPKPGTVVIVECIGWDPAFPYISGVWGDEYQAGEFSQDQLVMTDGKGTVLSIEPDKLFKFETDLKSLKEVLEKMIDETAAMQTQGPPPQHVVSPASVQKLQAIKTEIAKLLK